MYFFAIVIAVILTSIINVIFIKYNVANMTDILKITAMVLPLTFIQSASFAYYYNLGSKDIKFGILVLMAMSITIILNFLIQFLYFKQSLTLYELISSLIILLGISVYIYGKFN